MNELRERIKTLESTNQVKVEDDTNKKVDEKVVNLKQEEDEIAKVLNKTDNSRKGETPQQQQQQQHQQQQHQHQRGDDGLVDEDSNPERRLQSRSHHTK